MGEKVEDKLVLSIIAKPDPTTGTSKTYLSVDGLAVVNGKPREIEIDTTVKDINKLIDIIEDACCDKV